MLSFLDNMPNFDGMVFSQEDFSIAQKYLKSAIEKVDPAWLKKPQGTIGIQWNCNGIYPACYLINLAQIIYILDRNITAKSITSYHDKFKKLLRPANDDDYESRYTELQVAATFAQFASPIAFEPLVPEGTPESDRPRSPDFGIRLPDGDVAIEVTVFHFNILDQWDLSLNDITIFIKRFLNKNKLSYSVSLEVPLLHDKNEIMKILEQNIFRSMLKSNTGSTSYDKKFFINWKPLPFYKHLPKELPSGVNAAVIGDGMLQGSSMEWRLSEEGLTEINELVLKSFRNTLNLKRKQFPYESYYLLVIRLGHHRLNWDGINQLINTRIWPNKDYSWLTGLVSFTPRDNFEKNAPNRTLSLNPNPNTRHYSQNIIDLFEGKSTFHL